MTEAKIKCGKRAASQLNWKRTGGGARAVQLGFMGISPMKALAWSGMSSSSDAHDIF